MSLPFRALGLGGGGIKGVLHIGALQELSKHQPLTFPDGIYGSSIGSILATYLAFQLPLEKTVGLITKYLTFDAIVPPMNFQVMSSAFSHKGVHTMEMFESSVLNMFDECGLDLREKRIEDAAMPLYIVASNITKGTPTVFSGSVPVLDALKASCCIPGLFRPYPLYGQLFVDGDIFVPNVATLLSPEALVLTLYKQRRHALTPSVIESMSPLDYMSEIYSMSKRVAQDAHRTPNTLALKYPGLHSDSDLSEMDVDDILATAGRQLDMFLSTKRAH